MATVITCSECNRDLRPHCQDGRCDWWKCGNRACEAAVYDVRRGRLLRRDGRVEALDG